MKKLPTIISIITLFSLLITPLAKADVAVSVGVPPRASNFQFNFSSSSPQPLHQGQDSEYQITYGADASAGSSTTTTIVASWDAPTAPDNSQLLEYETGSATNAYGNVEPVIDPVNKTITWTIPNLPPGATDQTVTFKLRMITSYNKANSIDFALHAMMSNQYVTLPEQDLTQTYQYKTPLSTPAPTVTPPLTASPSPTLTLLPTGTPNTIFTALSVTGMTASQATIQSTTTSPTKLTILYGIRPSALNKTLITNAYTRRHTVSLGALAADTTYYFKIIALDSSGNTSSSEIFTLHTAKQSTIPNVENNIIVLSSNGNVFSSGSQQASDVKNPSIILTNNTDDTIAYTLTHPIAVKTIDVVVTNKVLGAATKASLGSAQDKTNTPEEYIFPMQMKTPTLYVANLTTIPQGSYDVAVRIIDDKGNIIQKHISDLKIMPRLAVYGADTKTPLSDARIFLSYYDEQTKSYQPVTSSLFGMINNPSYTDVSGQSPITLPAGKYRIEASSLFYDPLTEDFTIGPGVNQNFPVLSLTRDPFNVISLFVYTKGFVADSLTRMYSLVVEISSSVRIYHFAGLLILGTFTCLTFFFFLFRSHLSLRHLPIFILFHLERIRERHQQQYIFGQIVDEQNNPISRVRVEIEDAETKNILTHGSSHKTGKFYFTNLYSQSINLIFTKEGYTPTSITIDNGTSIPEQGIQITLIEGVSHHETLFSSFMIGLEDGFGMLFETFLVSSFLLEIFFFIFLRTQITLPFFFTLSLINIILWVFYRRESQSRLKIEDI